MYYQVDSDLGLLYSNPKSEAIELFHDPVFKYTPAIGGREYQPPINGEERNSPPTAVSSVWHRMLPIDDKGNYL